MKKYKQYKTVCHSDYVDDKYNPTFGQTYYILDIDDSGYSFWLIEPMSDSDIEKLIAGRLSAPRMTDYNFSKYFYNESEMRNMNIELILNENV